MECSNCNKTYDDDFKFCPYCGEKKPEPKICPNCEMEPSTEFNFCPECGTELVSKSQWEELKRKEELNKLNEQLKKYDLLDEKSLKYLDKAIELEPENSGYLEDKAYLLRYLGRYEEAIECYDKLIELEPKEYFHKDYKGDCLYALKKYEETLDISYGSEGSLNGGFFLEKIAMELITTNQEEEAIKYIEKYIELNPNDAFRWKMKVSCLSGLQRYEEEIECYDKLIELQHYDPIYWIRKGDCLYALKKYEEALNCYDEVIEQDKENEDSWIKTSILWTNKGKCLEKLGRDEEAEECYEKAKSLRD